MVKCDTWVGRVGCIAVLWAGVFGGVAIPTLHAQNPPEPWKFHRQLEEHPPLLEALEEIFALASARDKAAFRARFTDNTVKRLEASWNELDGPSGSWEKMMAALVSKDGTAPEIVQVTLDDPLEPQEAIVVVALDGRQHTLYLDRDLNEQPPIWRIEVRDLSVGALNLDSLNLDIVVADKERSILELSFGTGLGAPGQYVFRYDDSVNPAVTTSLLVTAELFVLPWLRLGAIYDLPLGFQESQVNGELVSEFVPSRLMLGVTWTPLYVNFAAESRIEIQALTYFGATIEGEPRLVPMFGGRVAFLQNAYEGADIYAGLYYQGGVNVLGILYGVGYRF